MKKRYLLVLILTFIVTACGKEAELVAINSNQLTDLIENDEDLKYIYIGRPTCPTCQMFQPNLEDAMKENIINVYYYNTDDAREFDESLMKEILEKLKVEVVPTLLKIEKKHEIDRLDGIQSKENIVEFLN